MKNCPQCGRTMDDELDYCPDCGRDVSTIASGYNSYNEYNDSDYDDEFDDRNAPSEKRGRKKREKKNKGGAQDDGSGYPQEHYGKQDPVTTGGWLLTFLVMMIPIVNLFMPFIWAFGSNTQPSKKSWARASLITTLIGILLSILLVVAMGSVISSLFSSAMGEESSLFSLLGGESSGDDELDDPLLGGDIGLEGDDPFGTFENEGDESSGIGLGDLDLEGGTGPSVGGEGVTLDPSTRPVDGAGDNSGEGSTLTPGEGAPQVTPAPTDGSQQGPTPENTPGSATSYQDVINALSQSPIYTMQALTPDVSVAFGSFMMLTDASGNSYACAAIKVKNTGTVEFKISDVLFINALQNGNSLMGGGSAAIYEEAEAASIYKTIYPGVEEIVYLGYPTYDTTSPVTITLETWDAESSIASQTFDMSVG